MEKKTGLEGYYSIVNNKKMRFGYTTGSCATGAAKAAALMLFTGKEQKACKLYDTKRNFIAS